MAQCFCGCGRKVRFGVRAVNRRGRTIRDDVDTVRRLLDGGMVSPNAEAFVHDGLTFCGVLAEATHSGVVPAPDVEQQTAGFMAFARQHFSEAALGRALRTNGISVDDAATGLRSGQLDPFADIDYPFKEQEPPDLGEDFVPMSDEDAAVLVADITDKLYEIVALADPPQDVLRVLQLGLMVVINGDGRDPTGLPRDALLAGQTVARLGFTARIYEFEEFESARTTDLALLDVFQETVEEHDDMTLAITDLAGRVAINESLDSAPGDETAFLWRTAGLGGHLRLEIAERCVAVTTLLDQHGTRQSWDAVSREDLIRSWIYGFAVRCLVELLNESERLR